jgi:XTP/dITP diphosphohydrolase
MTRKIKIAVATGNRHKFNEMQQMVPANIELAMAPAEMLIEEEIGSTYRENALIKASHCAAKLEIPCIADDSGIEVISLDCRPGLYSARYAPTDNAKISKLLSELGDNPNRDARFVCAIGLAYPNGQEYIFEGTCNGTIEHAPSGKGGFGYDPIFRVNSLNKVMAELSEEEKNRVSHRGIAMKQLHDWLSLMYMPNIKRRYVNNNFEEY